MTHSSANIENTSIPATTREWYEWLVQEEAKTVAVYRDKPTLLIADYHRERATASDYEGREVLELLQNANDQAAELGQHGRVLIELSAEGLIVANTGLPFSVGGVASLQTSHLSPKRRRRKQLIGNKGLGFRSILNWSKTPIILSKALCIAYCMEHAKRKLKELTATNPELARVVQDEQQGQDVLTLPLLPFPLYSVNGNLLPLIEDKCARSIFERCETLLLEGYDTVIGMPFDSTNGYEAASMQVNEIRPEILLFARHLGELCFRNGKEETLWTLAGNETVAEVLANGKKLGKWKIYRKTEELPVTVLELDDHAKSTDYEIVVAVPREKTKSSAPLFSYFPTNITMPLPLVCHATLELEQNRKHIQQGNKSNEFVLDRLADFLAEIAEQIAAESSTDPWAGCSLLMPLGDFSLDLKKARFLSQLMKAAQSRAIVPTLGGSPVRATSAQLVAGADVSWLPAALFSKVAPIRNAEELRFLESLGVPRLDPAVLKQIILDHPELSLDERVALVDGLLRHHIAKEAFTSALFLDVSEKGLEDALRVFIAPSNGEVAELPVWVDLRFLNEAMRSKLAARLGTRDNRELQQRLAGFGLLEYSLASVISALVAAANRAIKAAPDQAMTFDNDLLRTIFSLYYAEGQPIRRPEYPEKSSLRLRNQRNEPAAATTLYLGRGFGAQGEIIQALYEPWAPEKLICEPDLLGLTKDNKTLKAFLLWIGVCEWPRETLADNAAPAYKEYLIRKIPFPAFFGEYIVDSCKTLKSLSVKDVKSIDGIETILEKSEPNAIAAWLALDGRVQSWQRWSKDHAKLDGFPKGTQFKRNFPGELPSYLRWMIETHHWLLLPGGGRISPKDCVLGERLIETLFPRPAMPSEAELAHYGVCQSDLIEGWRRAGVLTSLASLERDEIYAKLLELPQRSPDGKLARPLYHWLLEASDIALGECGVNHKEFLKSGKMWGRHGDIEGYFLTAELHHADAEGLPEVLLRHLKIVDLRKRVGADKVERLFGVKPIGRAGIRQRIINYQAAVGSADASVNFQTAKPYLHKLRTSQTSQMTNLQTLKEIRLEVCSELQAEITYDGEPFAYDVPVWGWLIEGNKLFVRSDPAEPIELSADLLADAVGEALASIFRIGDGGDFARMFSCKESARQQLLRKMRGESVVDNIESIKAEFAAFQEDKRIEARFPVTEPPVPSVISNTSTVQIPASPGNLREDPVSPVATQPGLSSQLQITAEEHVVAPAAYKQKLRVTKITTPPQATTVTHRVTDGDFCVRKAMEFEETDDSPRFPLLVAQVVGSDGPGCDVLSFSTEKEREAFRAGPTRDLCSVSRFIEVKGRSNAAAAIELRGNELSAAENYGERYYLYRLFETDSGDFVLTILRNPLKHKEALQPAVHVGMERATATQKFSLTGGILRTQEP